jgi:hypothetical protein
MYFEDTDFGKTLSASIAPQFHLNLKRERGDKISEK